MTFLATDIKTDTLSMFYSTKNKLDFHLIMNKKKPIFSLSLITEKALPVLKKHAVKRASIFGSFARGSATSKSDVDFLIEYKEKNKSLFDLIDLKLDLEEILGRKVDIITYHSIYSRLRERILAEQVVIL